MRFGPAGLSYVVVYNWFGSDAPGSVICAIRPKGSKVANIKVKIVFFFIIVLFFN